MGSRLHTVGCLLLALSACRSLPLIATPEAVPLGTVAASPNVLGAGMATTITFQANSDVTQVWATVNDANAQQVSTQGNVTVFAYTATGQETQGAARLVVHGNNPQGPNTLASALIFDFTAPALGPATLSTGNANVMLSGTQVAYAASDSTAITCSVCVGINGGDCVPLAGSLDAAGDCLSAAVACNSNDVVTLLPQATDAAGNRSALPALTRKCVAQSPLPGALTTGVANPNYVPGSFTLGSRMPGDVASCDACVSDTGGACAAWQAATLQNGNCTLPVTCTDGALLSLAMRGTSSSGIVGLPITATRVCDTSVQLGSLVINGGSTATAIASGVSVATTLHDLGAGMQTCQLCVASTGNCSSGPWAAASVSSSGSCVSAAPISCSHGDTMVLSMRGVDGVGNTAQTAALTRTCDTTAPTFTSLTLTRPARKQLQYAWTATDTGAASNALSYSISYGKGPSGAGGTGAQEGNSPVSGLQGSGATLSNLPGCRRYYSSITVSDGVGNQATQPALSVPVGCGNDGTFAARDSVGAAQIKGLTLADIDRDGVQDAVMITPDDGHVVVRYSSPQVSPRGDFTAAMQSYAPYSGNFIALAVGDFDADGLQDIAATTDAGSLVTLHNNGGNGSGAFSVTSSYSVGANPRGIVVADFNGDNIADVATANTDDRTVSVLLGSGSNGVGNGSFNTAVTRPGGAGTAIVAADVNADHKLDWLTNDGHGSGALVVALGAGDGNFSTAAAYALNAGGNSQPSDLAVADFDRDNILDAAITNAGQGSVSLLRGTGSNGRGDGGFGTATQVSVNGQPTGLVAADLNADGIVDLAVSHAASASVGVLLGAGSNGRGTGSFAAESPFTTGGFASSLAAADIDGDGLTDLVVGGAPGGTATSSVTTLLGRGGGSLPDGSFLAPIQRGTLSGAPGYMVVGDLNADGIPDYVTPGNSNMEVAPGTGSNGQGLGVWGTHSQQAGVANPAGGLLADLNNDGILDVLYAAQTTQVSLLTGQGANGQGDATFAAHVEFTAASNASRTYWVDAADFNADRIPDLAVADIGGQVEILLGQSANAQGSAPQFAASSPVAVASAAVFVKAADLNHDGIQDLVATNASTSGNNVQVLLGQGSNGHGNGAFQVTQSYTAGAAYAVTAALGDYNGDGATDLAVSSQDGNVWLLLAQTSGGHGNGAFNAPVAVRSCSTATVMQSADLNRDGAADLVVVCATQVGVLMGNGGRHGNGTFAAPTFVNTTRAMASVVVADQDADGMLDLILSDRGGGLVQIAYGSGVYP